MAGTRISPILALALSLCVSSAAADSPLSNLLTLQRVDADPNKSYRLTPENGPWMVNACTFSNENGERQAHALAIELRKVYKLEAYVHAMHFDHGKAEGRGLNGLNGAVAMQYRRGNQSDEWAVLVGNYASVDDQNAKRALRKLKYSRPRALEIDPENPTSQNLAGWRLYAQKMTDKGEMGPMMRAFITPNPLRAQAQQQGGVADPLVVKMNRHVKHSLLECPGKYTVQVASFKGNVITKPSEVLAVKQGEKKVESRLAQAALNAHRMTEALRLKWEAYEFHDRHASIVTVGSFDSVGTKRADGKTEINPKIHYLMQQFGAEIVRLPGNPTPRSKPKTILGIPFDIQPQPVMVPKRSIGDEMASTGFR